MIDDFAIHPHAFHHDFQIRFHEIPLDLINTRLEDFFKIRRIGELDNTLIFANSDTGNSRIHSVDNLPIMTIGNAGGRMKTGNHIQGKGDPTSRIGLTAMQIMGINVNKWGTGSMETDKTISEILV